MNTRLKRAAAIAIVAWANLGQAGAFAALTYSLTDLGTFGGEASDAHAINAAGQMVGLSYIGNGWDAYRSNGNMMADLGTLGGSHSIGLGINQSGQVAGYSEISTSSGVTHAFLYTGGMMTDLETLGGANSFAYGINAAGQIVGNSDTSTSGVSDAFRYTGGMMTDLTMLTGGSLVKAIAINSAGQIAGNYSNGHAALYSGGTTTDLETLGGQVSFSNGMNEFGQVVGASYTAGGFEHAFLYSGGMMHDLGTLVGTESSAYGINAFGTIVGQAQPALNADFDGFIYSNDTMTDLNNLLDNSGAGYRVRGGFAINDNGWIAATALAPNGYEHAVLLTPVPEPVSVVLLAVGGIGIGALRRR